MGLILAIALLFSGVVVLFAMLVAFPAIFPPFVDFMNSVPGTETFGGHPEYMLFMIIFVVPLLFLATLTITVMIAGSMRREAHREQF